MGVKIENSCFSGGLRYLGEEPNFVLLFVTYFLFYLKDFVDG